MCQLIGCKTGACIGSDTLLLARYRGVSSSWSGWSSTIDRDSKHDYDCILWAGTTLSHGRHVTSALRTFYSSMQIPIAEDRFAVLCRLYFLLHRILWHA